MKKQVWKTEKEKGLNPVILDYISGEDLALDKKLIKYDIEVNKAHAKMLSKVGLISKQDCEKILKALNEIDPEKFELKQEYEDVHMNIEQYLTQKLGKTGEKINTARSRNDQIMADLKLFMKDKLEETIEGVESLQIVMKKFAKKYVKTIMPAYTHMQPAQPMTFGYWFECYIALLNEDLEKIKDCLKHIDVNPLGACAVAGTELPIDIDFTTKELGFSKKFENALATISSRGESETEILFCLSMLMLHLNKMAKDLQLWSTFEFNMIQLDDSICTGSSIMPQKKNPDPLEVIHAKTAEVISLLFQNFLILKNLISGYNKDTQLTKKSLMEGFGITLNTLEVMKIILENIKPNEKRMKEIVEKSGCLATKEANELVLKGTPFREAHKKIRKNYINKNR